LGLSTKSETRAEERDTSGRARQGRLQLTRACYKRQERVQLTSRVLRATPACASDKVRLRLFTHHRRFFNEEVAADDDDGSVSLNGEDVLDGDEEDDEEGTAPAKKAKPAKKKAVGAKQKRASEAKQAEAMLREFTKESAGDLAAMIMGKKSQGEKRADSFLAGLEAKYAGKGKKATKKKAKKEEELVDPMDDAEFERIQARMKKR